jgi:dephospho-CoA kinase
VGKWVGKYVIGLTGNIATGKSVVRKMLEHLGAYGIDADALAHRVIAKGAPGYKPVVETFGRYILRADGEIDRAKLGKLVFSDPDGLAYLEKIVHPIVDKAIDLIIKRARQPVVVIEAIKLFEAGISKDCDSIWVAYAPSEIQLFRLVTKRKMSEADAQQRISAQAPQGKKVRAAQVVITNMNTFEDTWRQVVTAWRKSVPKITVSQQESVAVSKEISAEGAVVERGRPGHSGEIARIINRIRKDGNELGSDDIMEAFGEKAFLLLRAGKDIIGLIGWQVENLIACTVDIVIDPGVQISKALTALISEMEIASLELQCEASLVFVSQEFETYRDVWKSLGYEQREIEALKVPAWQEAACESQTPETKLYFKQLRKDRILRPL